MSAQRKGPPEPLFDSVVFAPDRDRVPGTRHVISWDEGDEVEYLKAIEAVATRRVGLRRRGHDHGSWAELDLSASGVDPLREATSLEAARERWQAARPLVLPKRFADFSKEEGDRGLALAQRLRNPSGLADCLMERAAKLPTGLHYAPDAPVEIDDTDPRFISKVQLERATGPNLWAKTARLSDHDEDASLRLRVSFGLEKEDDASRDEDSHRAVTALAETLIPGAARINLQAGLARYLREVTGQELYPTQHIAYWNAPGGGALLHHDAFGEDDCGGQRGVLYTQVRGETAWLALSLSDLADRVEDYCEFLDSGGADWVRKALWPDRREFDRVQARIRNRKACEAELALPGCGMFGGLVNLGPDFTSFLADAGHAFFLGPGDAVLMPSHALTACTMHSVFCASDEMTFGISAALRGSKATETALKE